MISKEQFAFVFLMLYNFAFGIVVMADIQLLAVPYWILSSWWIEVLFALCYVLSGWIMATIIMIDVLVVAKGITILVKKKDKVVP